MIIDEDDYLAHYGMLRRSGRYPWGSGGDAMQNHRSFLGMIEAMRAEGLSDTQIARGFGLSKEEFSTKDFKALRTIANNEVKAANRIRAEHLRHDKGMSLQAIADEMGLKGESSVRALLAPGATAKGEKMQATADMLKEQIADGGYLDVGIGVEHYAGMSRTQFESVLGGLKNEGYVLENVQIDQVGSQTKTVVKVLAPEGTIYKDIVVDKDSIKSIAVKLEDEEFVPVRPPEMLDSKRLQITYADDGGTDADGTMYIRPGAEGLDLGGAQYAQVRVAVDGTHYIKGMAVYKDDLPKGVDIVFNTNKNDTGNKMDALKPLKTLPDGSLDIDNPFGSTIKPGGQRGVMNIVNEEGDWKEWNNALASQMLGKQKDSLAKEQLNKVVVRKREELDEILALTNPAVRRKLLESYSDAVDSSAVHLQAAAMDRQATSVILPVNSLKDTEIYAPHLRNGERVALVRYPHGGTFEIPELVVNNKNLDAKKILGSNPKDAVAINSRVAERLSGADFDGDFVLVIPNDSGKIKSRPALEGLKNFDPKARYPPYDGMKVMGGGHWDESKRKIVFGKNPDGTTKSPSGKEKQMQMGMASNLITDMQLKGASDSEVARAVRHSMVVIDAEKHALNYKASYETNAIEQLKKKYQSKPDSSGLGASTLLSRSTSDVQVARRQIGYKINPETGEKIYVEKGGGWTEPKVNKKTGAVTEVFHPYTSKSTRGAEAKDAHSLSSGTTMEKIYADHSNRLKALGNEGRKALVSTKSTPYSSTARKLYAPEVKSLDAKLNIALKNAPRERQAQILAGAVVRQKRDAKPGMEKAELKKVQAKAILTARERTGASKELIDITPKEWEAIQSGAVSNDKLKKILNNTDLDKVKEYATPRKQNTVMTDLKKQRAKQLLSSGRTPSEVADILGVSASTLSSSLK